MRLGLKWKILCKYSIQKANFAALTTLQKYHMGQIVPRDVWSTVWNNMFEGMLYFHRSKGLEMMSTISANDTLVVRKIPHINSGLRQQLLQISASAIVDFDELLQINEGDVVVMKDPNDSTSQVVRRVAALEGHEMVSSNDEDEPFVLREGQCWVLSDNKILKPMDCNDSRTYGPISMKNIVGRVIYRFRTFGDHGCVMNNMKSMIYDLPVLYRELDSSEMHRFAENDKTTKSS